MTTTAHEDQYTTTPEPLHQPYDTATILRRNVADLEIALRKQTERAESYAETLRSIASYVGAGGYNADTVDVGVFEEKIRWGIGEIMTRVAPVPAPAVPVPPATCKISLQVAIREMLQWLIDQRGKHGHNHKQSGIWDDDNGAMAGKPCEACAMYDKARALLQSAEVTDNAAADRLLEGGV